MAPDDDFEVRLFVASMKIWHSHCSCVLLMNISVKSGDIRGHGVEQRSSLPMVLFVEDKSSDHLAPKFNVR